MEDRGLVQMKGKGEVKTYWLVGATSKAIQKREVDLTELPPLFCRPRKSPILSSRQASIIGGFGMGSRRQSNVPRGASAEVDTSSSINLPLHDHSSSLRGLAHANRSSQYVSDPSSSKLTLDVGALENFEIPSDSVPTNYAYCPMKCSKSLDPFPHKKKIESQVTALKTPIQSRSLENCTKQIYIPLVNNNIPNGTLSGGEDSREDVDTPLLAPGDGARIVRNRKRPASEKFPEALPKRWHSLEEVLETCPEPSPSGNKSSKTRSSIRWLVGIRWHENGVRTSNASLRKAFRPYGDAQADRQSIV